MCALGLAAIGCSSVAVTPSPPTSALAPLVSGSSTTEPATTTTTTVPVDEAGPGPYVFPVDRADAPYGRTHDDYAATDIFACGATYLAPTNGVVLEVALSDTWDPQTDDPATRFGLFVSILGDDGVRYFGSQLDSVLVSTWDRVSAGQPLGVVGQTGEARNGACHLHLGISENCTNAEWEIRRGTIWPWRYLDDWKRGINTSPILEAMQIVDYAPNACRQAA